MSDIKAKEEKFVLENGKSREFSVVLYWLNIDLFYFTENFEMLKALYEFTAVYPKTIR